MTDRAPAFFAGLASVGNDGLPAGALLELKVEGYGTCCFFGGELNGCGRWFVEWMKLGKGRR